MSERADHSRHWHSKEDFLAMLIQADPALRDLLKEFDESAEQLRQLDDDFRAN